MAADSCIRIPREEAKRFGWITDAVKSAAEKLRPIKDEYLSTTSGNKALPKEDIAAIKPLLDYRDEIHGDVNEMNGLYTRLRSYSMRKPKYAAETEKMVSDYWKRHATERKATGGKLMEPPTTMEDAIRQGHYYATRNAMNRFRNKALEAGVIGKVTNPNFKAIGGRSYKELQAHNNPGEQYGILPWLRNIHEDVFSAHSKDAARVSWNKRMGAPRGKNEGLAPYLARKTLFALRNAPSTATSAIMWSPMFHTVNIGTRWLVPLLARADNIHPKGWARTAAAFREAARDFSDPAKQQALGQAGMVTLGPHAWRESGAPQLRSLFYKLPGAEKVLAPILETIDKAMPTIINYMGYVAYHMRVNDLLRKGADPKIASRVAAHEVSVLMGTIAKDSMTKGWREFADHALFSTRYTTTTLQLFSKAVAKDEALRNHLASKGFDPAKVEQAVKQHQSYFQKLLLKDYLTMLAFANVVNLYFTGLYNIPDKNGKKGAHPIWDNYGTNWYKDFVNVKAIAGVDPDTGKPIMMGNPFRSTRDIAELLTGWLAVADGSDTGESMLEPYLNKTNVFWQTFFDLAKGTDWSGRTLKQPTAPETMANYAGDVLERGTPLQQLGFNARPFLTATVTRMEGGDPEVWKDMTAAMDDASIGKLVIHALGGQTSTGEIYGQPKGETYDAQERVMSELANPVIRKELANNDPTITRMVRLHLQQAGIVGSAAQGYIQRAIRAEQGTAPVSKAVRVYAGEHQ